MNRHNVKILAAIFAIIGALIYLISSPLLKLPTPEEKKAEARLQFAITNEGAVMLAGLAEANRKSWMNNPRDSIGQEFYDDYISISNQLQSQQQPYLDFLATKQASRQANLQTVKAISFFFIILAVLCFLLLFITAPKKY